MTQAQYDFSMENPRIKAFFDGDSSSPPISEIKYLHEHPLIHGPHFLNQILDKLNHLQRINEQVNIPGSIADECKALTIQALLSVQNLEGKTPNVTLEDWIKILEAIRDINNLCEKVIQNYPDIK